MLNCRLYTVRSYSQSAFPQIHRFDSAQSPEFYNFQYVLAQETARLAAKTSEQICTATALQAVKVSLCGSRLRNSVNLKRICGIDRKELNVVHPYCSRDRVV